MAVTAVVRAVAIIDLVGRSPGPMTISEIGRELSLPKSSVHGLCNTMVELGLLRVQDQGPRYGPGRRLTELASYVHAPPDLVSEFRHVCAMGGPYLPEETIVLAVRDGHDAVYVSCRNGNQSIGVAYRIGLRLPASCTATGKALLGTLPTPEVLRLYDGVELPALTSRSITSMQRLLTVLDTARSQGFATDDEETSPGMFCVGAPVLGDVGGEAVAAVAISVIKAGLTDERARTITSTVQKIASALASRLHLGWEGEASRADGSVIPFSR